MGGGRHALLVAVVVVGMLAVVGGHGAPLAPAAASGADDPGEVTRPDAEARIEPIPEPGDAGSSSGDDEAAPASEATLQEIDETLGRVAEASAAGDVEALGTLLDDTGGEVGTRWRRQASRLGELPLERYDLRVDRRLGEVTTDRVRARYDDEVRVVAVVEELAVAGQDRDGAGRHRRTLTLVRRGEGWRLVDDADGRPLGLSTPVHLWDLGEVTATGTGSVVALHHPEAPDVPSLVRDVEEAIVELRDRWPLDWSERAVLVVPRDREELEDLLDAELHLDDFLAFATATAWSEPGSHDLLGSRVAVNPDRFPELEGEVRERVLLHEMLHVATRPVGSAAIPLWLEEGVAQALGERGPSTGSTQRLDALGAEGRRLPTDEEFTAAGTDGTLLAYQRSWSFTDHLVQRHGERAVADFYADVGASASRPGTTEHHLDAAARRSLDAEIDGLVARWRDAS